jgi:poly(A) polymerase
MRKAAQRIVEKLRLHGYEAFFAGGWVRDFLLRRKPKDIDIATSALPDDILKIFPTSRAIGAAFGVVQVLMYGHTYEVATFRKDNAYLNGRHPSSVDFSGPKEDALRRDFTINGLFYDPGADRLIDYIHGKNDIQNKLIRTIGDPVLRFTEDKLRLLRAIRFSCNLGFNIVPETWDAIQKLAPAILQISWERIRDELTRILTSPDPYSGLDLLEKSGLLQPILPEIAAMRNTPQSPASPSGNDVFAHTQTMLAMLHKPSDVLAYATLMHDAGKPAVYSMNRQSGFDGQLSVGSKMTEEICRRLRMPNDEIRKIVDLVLTHEDFLQWDTLREGARIRLLQKNNIQDHLELFRVHCHGNSKNQAIYSSCVQRLEEFRQTPAPDPLVSGEDLISLGYLPGPIYKEILQTIEDLQYECVLRTREDALKYIQNAFPFG